MLESAFIIQAERNLRWLIAQNRGWKDLFLGVENGIRNGGKY